MNANQSQDSFKSIESINFTSGCVAISINSSRSGYQYEIEKIVWENPHSDLPDGAVIVLPDHLVHSGPENFEPEGFDDQFDDMDDDELEEFYENYEPSIEAQVAWEQSWDLTIIAILESQYSQKVKSIGGFHPAD